MAAGLLAAIGVGALVLSRLALAAHWEVGPASVAAGLGHALLCGTLLALFGQSMRPGRVALVTMMAQRINPRFRPGMIPYSRAVNWLWCAFFAVQLAGSALLLLF